MRIFTFIFLTTFTLLNSNLFAQQFTISGKIVDSLTGETLINAHVYDNNSAEGTVSNEYGFYSLTLNKGLINLNFSYVGYKSQQYSFNLNSDTILNVNLKPGKQIEKVTITQDKNQQFLNSPQTSLLRLNPETVKKMPVIMGEPDLVKTVQLLPGVQRGHEGFSGMFVRGGNNDQNLILLDGVPVYNVNHLYGMFSVFNPYAIKSVKLYKGGFPARYHGRISSVLDIRMKEGNMKEFKGEGSIGLVASKLSLEGPLKKDISSFIITGRRTFIDILTYPFVKQKLGGDLAGYFFYDVNGKVNYKFSDKSLLYLSVYTGKDRFYHKREDHYTFNRVEHEIDTKDRLEWGNITGLLRWNYSFGNKLFSNFSLSYSNYRFVTGQDYKEEFNDSTLSYDYKYSSGVKEVTAAIDFDYVPGANHYFRFGIKGSYNQFNPGVSVGARTSYSPVQVDTTFGSEEIFGREFSVYIEDDWEIMQKLRANIGLNYNFYSVQNKIHANFEPRISLRYSLNKNASVKASWGLMNQYLHLLTHTSIGLPTDLWVPVTQKIPPVHSSQYVLSGVYKLNEDINISVEGFYKEMDDLIEYKEGESYWSEETNWQAKVTTGSGTSYGFELFVEKSGERTTGWISYTLSYAERKFNNLNFGEPFPFKYDRRHVFNISVSHNFNDRLSLNTTWVYNTGRATTYSFQDIYILYGSRTYPYYSGRNNLRFPDHHRLDIGLNMSKKKKWGKRIWKIGLYNAYSRINPFYLKTNREGNLVKIGLFPVLPYISYHFIF